MSSLVNAALNQAGIVRPANAGQGGRGVVGSVVGHSAGHNGAGGQSSRMEVEGSSGVERTRRDGGREGRGGRGGGRARKGGRNGADHQVCMFFLVFFYQSVLGCSGIL